MGYRCCRMADFTKIVVDVFTSKPLLTFAGYVAGLATEPLKLWFKKREDLKNMQYSLYREMAGNFQHLVGVLHTIRLNTNSAVSYMLHDIKQSEERFIEARKDNRFDQLKHVNGIKRMYSSFRRLIGKASRPEDMEIADEIIVQIEQDLNTGQLDSKRFFQFLDKRLVKRIKSGLSCTQPFPEDRQC
jgi:hypothetical protein